MAKFEVQARVVDLLGTQQIANCPTAISELFKNAYDAYARRVSLDVSPEKGYALLWDDGIGMTEQELLHRWLVVGAAGKAKLRSSTKPPHGMEPRAIQGEKGIGRLAISTLGDTLLVVSRSIKPPAGGDPFVALLINWNLVRNERLLLSEIELPTITFSSLEELNTGIVEDMVASLRSVVTENATAWEDDHGALRTTILRQLDSFEVDIAVLQSITSTEWAADRGTLFFVRNLVSEFREYLDRPNRDENQARHPNVELVQLLANFRKSLEIEKESSVDGDGSDVAGREFFADVRQLDPKIRRWRSLFKDHEAIGSEDLREYDHYIDVNFDEYGRYEGVFEIYGNPAKLPPLELQPKRSLSCGPLRLRLWYFQGRPSESRLGPDAFQAIDNKLPLFGGLMIYRDNLRVLPYGNPEFDWLLFEERRSKGAGRYHFSYRRMFGYVDISRRENARLIDKAGREGLIQNSAYRDLRETLIDFFGELALRNFYKGEFFKQEKGDLKEKSDRLKAERKLVAEKRKEIREQARARIKFIDQNGPEQLELFLEQSLDELRTVPSPGNPEVTDAIIRFENRLAQKEGRARLNVPTSLSLGRGRELNRLVHDHSAAYAEFSKSCNEIRRKFSRVLSTEWPEAEASVDLQRTLDNAYKQALAKIGKSHQALVARIDEHGRMLAQHLDSDYQQQRAKVDEILIAGTGTSTLEEARRAEPQDLSKTLGALSRISTSVSETLTDRGHELFSSLNSVIVGDLAKLQKYQFEEIEELQEQVDQNL